MQGSAPLHERATQQHDRLGRLPLRWLVSSLTLLGIIAFVALGISNPRVAPVALAGALVVALKGLGWLLVLRHYRVRLRRHGYRW